MARASLRSASPPRVALVVETSTSFGRRLLAGIAAYVREKGPWSMYFDERAVFDPVPGWLPRWKGDGIISRIASPEIRRVARRSRIPVVDLNEQLGGLGAPQISIDHEAVGRMAAQHLLHRGFTRFAYAGHAGRPFSDRRRDAFQNAVREAGHRCDEYRGHKEDFRSLRLGSWELEMDRIAGWIAKFPKPVGLMACHDFRALQVLAACRLADVAVPEQAAVIGVGADEVACALADPPLSSIILNAFRMGYEAAGLLDRLMRGERGAPAETLIPPMEVSVRQSTDIMAISDPIVARAMRFIREHVSDGINVQDVVRHIGMSRTALQDHFRDALGRTVHDALIDARIGRVRELLVGADLPLAEIAGRAGFRYPEYMISTFKQRTGWTPARYRTEHGASKTIAALPKSALTDNRSSP